MIDPKAIDMNGFDKITDAMKVKAVKEAEAEETRERMRFGDRKHEKEMAVEDRKHEKELATIVDGQDKRREVTLRFLSPFVIVGVFGVLVFAIIMNKVAEFTSSMVILLAAFQFLRGLLKQKVKTPRKTQERDPDCALAAAKGKTRP